MKRHGWASGTIRSQLLNAKYIGEWTWNQREFRRHGTNTRKARNRPEEDWVKTSMPHLALIPRDLWDAVQARFKAREGTKCGRSLGSSQTPYLLSGLLKCASCGGPMIVVSRPKGYANYGCGPHANKGDAICANGQTISEKKVVEGVVGAIRDLLNTPELVARFIEKFHARVASVRALARADDTESHEIERDIAAVQRSVQNITDAISQLGLDETLTAKFKAEKARLAALKERQANRVALAAPEAEVPTEDETLAYLEELVGTLERDPARGREILKENVGEILLTPERDGDRRFYVASGALNIRAALDFSKAARKSSLRMVAGTGFSRRRILCHRRTRRSFPSTPPSGDHARRSLLGPDYFDQSRSKRASTSSRSNAGAPARRTAGRSRAAPWSSFRRRPASTPNEAPWSASGRSPSSASFASTRSMNRLDLKSAPAARS